MRFLINEYLQVIIYAICGILLILGSYIILINVNHYEEINKKVVVSDADTDYQKYKENILEIENELSHLNKPNNVCLLMIKDNLELLKKDGLYRLIPNNKIDYSDVYLLNNYFIESIIDDGWTNKLKDVLKKDSYDNDIKVLVKNANYIKNVLLNNSSYHYQHKNDSYNSIDNEYHFIVNNYLAYSNFLLDIIENVGC